MIRNPHYTELFTEADLADALARGLIRRRPNGVGLSIYNYTDKAQFEPGAFDNPAVRYSRGLILDYCGCVVARPLPKFFNVSQLADVDLDEPVLVTDKLDGSLGIAYRDIMWTVSIATRGSFDSEQARHATEWLHDDARVGLRAWIKEQLDQGFTPLFEIIYPENRIVIDYGDRDELVLLGMVNNHTGFFWPAAVLDSRRLNGVRKAKEVDYMTVREALLLPSRPGKEGYVLVGSGAPPQTLMKVKQSDYVELHKARFHLSERSIWQALMDQRQRDEFISVLPDELHPWACEVWDRIAGQGVDMVREANATFRRLNLGGANRAEFAHAVLDATDDPTMRACLFARYDHKPMTPIILKALKPTATPTRTAVPA